MGAADIVPGVSGGTIAFISGIYQRLINSIKAFDYRLFPLIKRLDLKAIWRQIDGTFLTVLFAGIITSFVSLAKIVKYLISYYPLLLWSFFFGLILASIITVIKEIKQWNKMVILSLILGSIIAYYLTIISPSETPESWWFIFISGMIAICAMILPGVSGSFLLLMIGKYSFILGTISNLVNSIKEVDINGILENGLPILIFILGCIIGLLSFSHFISWVLKRYWNVSIALLAGFMTGSLNKIWPWKEVIETYTNRRGEIKPLIEKSVLPHIYESSLELNPQIFYCLSFMLLGFFIVLILKSASKNYEI